MLEIELSEYQTKVIDGVVPTDADFVLAARLDTEFDSKIKIRWLRGDRVEITSTSWVGVVHLDGVRIVVRPKYAGDELHVVRMLEYVGGLDRVRSFDAERTVDLSGTDLLELVASLFAAEAERILLEGPLHDYRTEEADLPVLRGTLRYREQATRRFGQLDRLECRFDEFDADVVENHLLLAGATVGARLLRSGPTRLRLRRLAATLEDVVSPSRLGADDFRRMLVYGRRNERYRRAHDLALLLLDHIGVDDLWRASPSSSHVFLLNMNTVFEDFVTRMMAEAFTGDGWSVDGQRRTKSVITDGETGKHYLTVVPDIVVSNGTSTLPIDCKYKLYGDDKKLSTGDVYQSFLYAFSLGTRPGAVSASAVIHPAAETRHRRSLAIGRVGETDAAQIGVVELDLVRAVDSLASPEEWAELLTLLRSVILPLARPGVAGSDDLVAAATYLSMVADRVSGEGSVVDQVAGLSPEVVGALPVAEAAALAVEMRSLAERLKQLRAVSIRETAAGQLG